MIKLNSVFKEYIWGGTKIRDVLGKDTGDKQRIAESWEVSTHPDGMSVVAEGKYAGKTLAEYFSAVGWEKAGDYAKRNHRLPLLIKYIDAKENLSIQVHPDDKYARKHERECGKNEMWFVLSAEENAFIYLGFKQEMTKEEIRKRIENNTLEEALNKVPVHKDEAYYIPCGTVHAIGAGCLICEVQQPSNITYRLYDYGRADVNGNRRPLHIDKALDVLNYHKTDIEGLYSRDTMSMEQFIRGLFGRNGSCTVLKYEADGDLTVLLPETRLTFALVTEGEGKIFTVDESAKTQKGDTWLIHGRATRVKGNCKILLILI